MRRRATKHQARPAKTSRPLADLDTLGLLRAAIETELERLQGKQGAKMTPTQRGTLLQRCVRMRVQLGELTGEALEMPETKIVKLPAFRRVVDRMVKALDPWPDALRALVTAMNGPGDVRAEGTGT